MVFNLNPDPLNLLFLGSFSTEIYAFIKHYLGYMGNSPLIGTLICDYRNVCILYIICITNKLKANWRTVAFPEYRNR